MLALRHKAFAAFAAVAMTTALAGSAGAQGAGAPPKACEVDEGRPSDVAKAYLALQQVLGNTSPKPGEIPKLLSGAVKGLVGGNDNPVGRSYELGKALVVWTMQPDMALVTKRGPLGFEKNADAPIDLVVVIDSVFSVVEKAMPECKVETLKWRSQKAWIGLVNGGMNDLNADNLDSAEAHANRSLILNHDSPYPYFILGQVASRRTKTDDAIKYFQQTVAMAGTDSTVAEIKRNTLNTMATLASNAAEDAQDPAVKAKYVALAKSSYETLVSVAPAGSPYAEAGRSGLIRVNLAAGDTAAVKAGYAPMIANPSAFSFNQLLQGGVVASNANDTEGAIKLFDGAYQASPYHRDALKNLAIVYAKAKSFDKVLPLFQRLMEVDPNGEGNGQLGVFAYGGIGENYRKMNLDIVARFNAAKDPKVKKVLSDSATLTADSNRYYVGIAVDLLGKADSQAVKVRFSEFSTQGDKTVLSGTIVNNTAADKSYVLAVEFLDKAGKALATGTANVGPVAPQGSGKFSLSSTTPGIVAFKYTPLK